MAEKKWFISFWGTGIHMSSFISPMWNFIMNLKFSKWPELYSTLKEKQQHIQSYKIQDNVIKLHLWRERWLKQSEVLKWKLSKMKAAIKKYSYPGDVPDQGWNPGLLHCRQILYHWATREALISLLLTDFSSCGCILPPSLKPIMFLSIFFFFSPNLTS